MRLSYGVAGFRISGKKAKRSPEKAEILKVRSFPPLFLFFLAKHRLTKPNFGRRHPHITQYVAVASRTDYTPPFATAPTASGSAARGARVGAHALPLALTVDGACFGSPIWESFGVWQVPCGLRGRSNRGGALCLRDISTVYKCDSGVVPSSIYTYTETRRDLVKISKIGEFLLFGQISTRHAEFRETAPSYRPCILYSRE